MWWGGHENCGICIYCWWEYKIIPSFWLFLKMWNMDMPCDPAIQLLCIHLGEMRAYVHAKTCTQVLVTALFTIVPKWEQHKCPLTSEGIKNGVYPYNGMLFDNSSTHTHTHNQWSTDTCYNKYTHWKPYNKRKKLVIKNTYFIILFIWDNQRRQFCRNRK